ncbi:aromatic acid exporter family protein [Streptomyces fuscigenes]|uniref:aromatic acid exporter family protein n=1 Tax=Streptomyces fuscigenes TaxID=1528880 RepID=UPI001F3473C2|nr:aromatic acid exporter family protein [Streptomyces fuscigenes]MCF3962166.1 aromatic acid exporter family protein [Streptomyces fuscigenes]
MTAIGRAARRAAEGPGPERDLVVQSLKAAGAALLAWAITGWWWNAPLALVAPWAAVALVQSTVYRSLRSALQQGVVIAVGTVIGSLAAVLTHDVTAALALALPAAVLIGNYARFGTWGAYAPTTALFVVTYGSYTWADLYQRLVEVVVGSVVGVAVNALVLPPVHLRDLGIAMRRLPRESAELLEAMAGDLRDGHAVQRAEAWHDRARRLSGTVDELRGARTWSLESHRLNPGGRLRRGAALPPAEWDMAWERIVQHLAAVTRMLADVAAEAAQEPGPAGAGDRVRRAERLVAATARVCRADEHALAPSVGVGSRAARRGSSGPAGAPVPGRGVSTGAAAADPVSDHEVRDVLAAAWEAHEGLRSALFEQGPESAEALGALVGETRHLLRALGSTGRVPTRAGTPRRRAGARPARTRPPLRAWLRQPRRPGGRPLIGSRSRGRRSAARMR